MILVNLEASTDSDSILLAKSILEKKLRPQNGRIHSQIQKLNTKFERAGEHEECGNFELFVSNTYGNIRQQKTAALLVDKIVNESDILCTISSF